ncbi:MAG: serine hydrolase [Cyclobacteriaceae bacterium]
MKYLKYISIFVFFSCVSDDGLLKDQTVWGYAKPSTLGLDEATLLSINEEIEEGEFEDIKSVLIIKNDHIVFENYYDGSFRSELRPIGLATQIVTVGILGRLIDEGYIESLDDPISKYLPSYFNVFDAQPEKKEITIQHLLDNKSGLVWNESIKQYIDEDNDINRMKTESADWPGYVLKRDLEAPPGIRHVQNSGTSALLMSIIETALGDVDLESYIRTNIFQPLEIVNYKWASDPKGNLDGVTGLHLNDIDFAKLGYLFMNYGNWNRERVIPEGWAFEMLGTQSLASNTFSFGYGWRSFSDNLSSILGYSADEIFFSPVHHGQMLFIIPKSGIVMSVYAENHFYKLGSPTFSLFIRTFRQSTN